MVEFAILIIGATLFVAYASGANDNFKGMATLFGSGPPPGHWVWIGRLAW